MPRLQLILQSRSCILRPPGVTAGGEILHCGSSAKHFHLANNLAGEHYRKETHFHAAEKPHYKGDATLTRGSNNIRAGSSTAGPSKIFMKSMCHQYEVHCSHCMLRETSFVLYGPRTCLKPVPDVVGTCFTCHLSKEIHTER